MGITSFFSDFAVLVAPCVWANLRCASRSAVLAILIYASNPCPFPCSALFGAVGPSAVGPLVPFTCYNIIKYGWLFSISRRLFARVFNSLICNQTTSTHLFIAFFSNARWPRTILSSVLSNNFPRPCICARPSTTRLIAASDLPITPFAFNYARRNISSKCYGFIFYT